MVFKLCCTLTRPLTYRDWISKSPRCPVKEEVAGINPESSGLLTYWPRYTAIYVAMST